MAWFSDDDNGHDEEEKNKPDDRRGVEPGGNGKKTESGERQLAPWYPHGDLKSGTEL